MKLRYGLGVAIFALPLFSISGRTQTPVAVDQPVTDSERATDIITDTHSSAPAPAHPQTPATASAPAPAHAPAPAVSSDDSFYVYSHASNDLNRFAPSGWMGDYGDIRLDPFNKESPRKGTMCIKVNYSAAARQGAAWAGVYWQHPSNNWGGKPGYDLSAYKRLTFWARGAVGHERVEFKMGGIKGEHADTDTATTGPVDLTKDWVQFTLDLSKKNLTNIAGGFCWTATQADNEDGITFYLDDIRYEK